MMETNYFNQLALTCMDGDGTITVNCDTIGNNITKTCNVSITCDQCCTPTINAIPTTKSKDCSCGPDSHNQQICKSEPTTGSMIINNGFSTSNSSNSTALPLANSTELALAALGAIVGLLLVLLITVSTVLAWTCWLLKRRGGMKFNTENELR